MNTTYHSRPTSAQSFPGSSLTLEQWLLLGRGLWWLLAVFQFALFLMPTLWHRLALQLRFGLWWLILLGLLCVLCELVYMLLHVARQRRITARSQYGYLRIRLPVPREAMYKHAHSAHELWHSLHALFEGQSWRGDQPWLSLSFGAAADQKYICGAMIGSQRQQGLAELLASLRHILSGYAPEALIEQADDPLMQACDAAPDGAVLACLELLPSCGPEYILRTIQESGTDLLTPVLAQLRPHGQVLYCAIELSVRPRREQLATLVGWRARAVQRLMRSRRSIPMPDMHTSANLIQEKLNAPAYESVLRLCCVCSSRSAASFALQEGVAAYAHYGRRDGQRHQRLRPKHRSIQSIRKARPAYQTPDTRHKTQDTRHEIRDTREKTQDTRHETRDSNPAIGSSFNCAQGLSEKAFKGLQGRDAHKKEHFMVRLVNFVPWCPGGEGIFQIASQGRWLSAISYRLSATGYRRPPPQAISRLLLPVGVLPAPGILSSQELAGLWHLPGQEQLGLADWLGCRYLAAAATAQIAAPAEIQRGSNTGLFYASREAAKPQKPFKRSHWSVEFDSGSMGLQAPAGRDVGRSLQDLGPRITLGHAIRPDGSLVPVGPYLRDLRQILHITAGMGAGKSRLLANLAQQLLQPGFVLIDGKGDDAGNLATSVRNLIPQADEQRLVLLDMTDTDWPVGINPLLSIDRQRQGTLDQLSAMLDSVFARIDPETWQQAPGMQQFLGNATRLVVESEPQPTLLHVQRVLLDEAYRKQLLARASNLELIIFWRDIFPKMGEGQRSSMLALLRRFERLLGSELVRSFVSQQHSSFRFSQAFEHRLIVICPIPHVSYGSLASTVAMLIFMSMMRAAFERPGTATTRIDYTLIIDEFQVLVERGATQDIATALTQLRSLGIPSIYAHQTLSQIGDLRDLLMVNAENRVILRTQEPDASVYARHYAASGICAADISSQEPGEHQYARFGVAGSPMALCSIKPLPWPEVGGQGLEVRGRGGRAHVADWRGVLPAGSVEQQRYDRQLAELCHKPYSAEPAQALAQSSPEDWELIMQRWPLIAQAQRRHILTQPACIPERLERQKWLSRLGFARPRLLVEAEYRRLRA